MGPGAGEVEDLVAAPPTPAASARRRSADSGRAIHSTPRGAVSGWSANPSGGDSMKGRDARTSPSTGAEP